MRPWFLFLLCSSISWADHEPAVTIADLTKQIAQTPLLPELYYQRGVELIALQDLPKAQADFEQALQLRADFLPAKRYLARIADQSGHPEQALAILREAILKAPEEHRFLLPSCHQLEAELLVELHQPEAALTAINKALLDRIPALETWRLQAQILQQLGQTDAALNSLKLAWEKTRAIILRNEWLDALIAAGRKNEALPIIEAELASTRIRSGWLIRRARLSLQDQRTDAARADLREAIDELTPRLAINPPPALLLCDRGLAYALLGEIAAAKQDLAAARKLGISETTCRTLVATLGNR